MMTIHEILGRLHGVKDGPNGTYLARCPAHEDKNASLSIASGKDGKILIHCFAGCSFEKIVGAMGITENDLMGDPRPRNRMGKKVCSYVYQNSEGKPIFEVVRYEPKDFRAKTFKPDDPKADKEGFVFGLSKNNAKPVLYHLPEVVAKAARKGVVFVAEGEKDADALRGLGFCATTAPFGARREWEDDFTASLSGASLVVICADNDPPEKDFPGQRRAWMVGEKLTAAGIKVVRIVFPQKGKERVKDAADWIAAGGTAEQLKRLVKDYLDPSREETKWPSRWMFDGMYIPASCGGIVRAAALPPSPLPASEEVVEVGKRRFDVPSFSTLKELIEKLLRAAAKTDDDDERKLSPFEIKAVRCAAIIYWLKKNGSFYFHADPQKCGVISDMYFFVPEKKLYVIESDLFRSWLSFRSGVNWATNDYKYLSADIHSETLQGEDRKGVLPQNYWARKKGNVYLSCGEGKIAKMSPGKVEMVDNGTDGVLFDLGRTLEPWSLMEGEGKSPLETCSLFRDMAGSDGAKTLLELWILGLPFNHICKPPIVFSGDVGSGKTRTAVGLFELFGVPKRILCAEKNEKGLEDLWLSIDGGGLICIDNVDSRISWLPDAVSSASTNGSLAKRQLYTEKEMLYRANAACMITSANASFAEDAGLADRLIVIRLDRRISNTAESRLTKEIEENRNSAMTWICRTIAAALADNGDIIQGINRRHPDWAEFAQRCARVLGKFDLAIDAMKSAELDKSRFNIQNDFLGNLLLQTFNDPSEKWRGTASDLLATIMERNKGLTERERDRISPVKIGKKLLAIWPHLQIIFDVDKSMIRGCTYYSFSGAKVGMVGVMGVSDKTSTRKEAREKVFQTPPLPPPSTTENKEEKGYKENNRDDGGTEDDSSFEIGEF